MKTYHIEYLEYIDRRVKKQELNIIDMNSNEKTKQ